MVIAAKLFAFLGLRLYPISFCIHPKTEKKIWTCQNVETTIEKKVIFTKVQGPLAYLEVWSVPTSIQERIMTVGFPANRDWIRIRPIRHMNDIGETSYVTENWFTVASGDVQHDRGLNCRVLYKGRLSEQSWTIM